MLGIDVHPYYQRDVTSWPAVAGAGVGWVYVKVSDGTAAYAKKVGNTTYRSDTHVAGARSAGLPVGGYHYAQFGDPVTQADVLVREVRRLGCSLPPMLDLESPFVANMDAANFSLAFCRRVAGAGLRPAIYMSASFAKVLRPDQWGIAGLVIWVAAYGTNTSRLPYDQRAESGKVRQYYAGRMDIHQFGSTGRIPGIAQEVDVNESFTDLGGEDEMDQATLDAINDQGWRQWLLNSGRENMPSGDEAEAMGIPERLWNESCWPNIRANDLGWRQWAVNNNRKAIPDGDEAAAMGIPKRLWKEPVPLVARLDAIVTGGLDADAVAAAMAPTVAKAVNDEFARRQVD